MSYFHEEQTFRSPWVWGILAFAFLPLSVAALLGHFNSDLLEGVTVLAFIAALFLLARLVVDVDATQIRISFHFLWPTRRIPISDVRTARAKEYNSLLDYGGGACASPGRGGPSTPEAPNACWWRSSAGSGS